MSQIFILNSTHMSCIVIMESEIAVLRIAQNGLQYCITYHLVLKYHNIKTCLLQIGAQLASNYKSECIWDARIVF